MCLNCIRGQVDITEGIAKQEMVNFCKGCERYLQPPKYWLKAELESRELLHLCLKRIKGLNKLKLIDANFIWTEPHSRRLKIRITVQKEVCSCDGVLSCFTRVFQKLTTTKIFRCKNFKFSYYAKKTNLGL